MPTEDQFPKIDKFEFNKRAFKRNYRDKLNKFAISCKVSLDKNVSSQYRRDVVRIICLLEETLAKEVTYEIGNVYYLISLLENHLEFLKQLSERVADLNQGLHLAYDGIRQRTDKLISELEDNLKKPISITEMVNG